MVATKKVSSTKLKKASGAGSQKIEKRLECSTKGLVKKKELLKSSGGRLIVRKRKPIKSAGSKIGPIPKPKCENIEVK